ncbi:PKD domain-containing protein [Oscillatoria amoena NRMC-F 0135]|nr:PKD domain-containing protein [Oscillatoria amoena NRMC-F 0135]
MDDLVSFKVSSGQTITATQWDFGDGNTSTQSAPGYKYNVAKAYTVTAIVTLQNGTKCTATHNIIIHPKPISNFSVNGNSSFCFNKNKVCVTDNSTPGATGNPIAQRVFLWDDGAGDNSTNPSAQKVLCHTYFQTGTYTLIMENHRR